MPEPGPDDLSQLGCVPRHSCGQAKPRHIPHSSEKCMLEGGCGIRPGGDKWPPCSALVCRASLGVGGQAARRSPVPECLVVLGSLESVPRPGARRGDHVSVAIHRLTTSVIPCTGIDDESQA